MPHAPFFRRSATSEACLLALVLGTFLAIGCQTDPRPASLDPDEAPTDARVEGIWVSDRDSLLLAFNDDGTLLIEGSDSLVGRNWDRYADSLAFYFHTERDPEVHTVHHAIVSLDAVTLVLAPTTPPFGGRYTRR